MSTSNLSNMKNDEKLESARMTLCTAEQLENIKSNPVVKTTILTVLHSIPIIGELVDTSIDTALTKFQESKRNELVNIILSDSGNITSEMVNDVEFILNFARTLEAVNRLATNDKVKYFANMIKNGYLKSSKIDNDEFEEYLFALSTLSYRQINILIDLYTYEKNYVKEYNGKDET